MDIYRVISGWLFCRPFQSRLISSHLGRTFIAELVEKHHALCLGLVETVLQMEIVPFTQNTHYLETCTQKWLSKYKDARAGKGHVLAEDGQPVTKPNSFTAFGESPDCDSLYMKRNAVAPSVNPLGFGTSTKTQSFSFAPPSPTSALSSFTKPCSTSTPHDTSARTRSRKGNVLTEDGQPATKPNPFTAFGESPDCDGLHMKVD